MSGFFGFFFGAQAATGLNYSTYRQAPNIRVVTVINFGSSLSDLDEDVYHEIVHGGGVAGENPISGGLSLTHDLSNYGTRYDNLIQTCKPLVK